MVPPPAQIGMPLGEVETPALLIDLKTYERNLDRMARSLAGHPARLRAHAKTHKCPIIAQHQIDRGAIGVCCQTVGEAEAMVRGGVRNVLVTNQVVTPGKIRRLVALAAQAEVMVCVDNEMNVKDLDDTARAMGVRLPVLVEVDLGMNRCGVEPGMPTYDLARQVAEKPGLRFAGLHAYQGMAQHIYERAAREAAMCRAIALVDDTVGLLRSRGLECEIVTGAGTGTYPFEAASGVYNEVQPGSYIFMDADYLRVEGEPTTFESSLFVLTTILSRAKGRAVCDAGLKASSIDSGLPKVKDRPEIRYIGAADEHGKLEFEETSADLRIGDPLWLIPGHCDPTVNLYDWYVGIRDGHVETLWEITARGASA